MHGETIKNN